MSHKFTTPAIDKLRPVVDRIKEGVIREGDHFSEATSHSAYNANLPEGLTPDVVDSVQKYNITFVKAAHVAVGELGADVFAANKSVDKVTAKLGFFGPGSHVELAAERSHSFLNPQAKPGEDATIVKECFVSGKTVVSTGDVRSIRTAISQQFAEQNAK